MSHLTDWSMRDELLKVKLGYYVYPNLKYFTLCAIGTKYCILTNTRTDERTTEVLDFSGRPFRPGTEKVGIHFPMKEFIYNPTLIYMNMHVPVPALSVAKLCNC